MGADEAMPHPNTVLFLCPDWMKLEETRQKANLGCVISPDLVKFEKPVNFPCLRNHPQLPATPGVVLPIFIFRVFLLPPDIISQQISVEVAPAPKFRDLSQYCKNPCDP